MLKTSFPLHVLFFVFSFFFISEFALSAPKPKLNDVENEKVLTLLSGIRTAFSEADAETGAKKMEVFQSKIETSLKEDILPTLLFILVEQSQIKDQIKANEAELAKKPNDPKLTKKAKDLAAELLRISNIKSFIVKNLKTNVSLPWKNEMNMENLKNMGIVYSKSKNVFTLDDKKVKATTALLMEGIKLKMDENGDSSVSENEFSFFSFDLESRFNLAIEYLNR